MDTVKVDLQKLQLLNDRITQTIEALDQVRASVHGIQHSMGAGQQQVGIGQGWPQNESWQQRQGWPQGQGGLSHSTLGGFRPYSAMMQQPQLGFGYGYQTQGAQMPFAQQGGISHSGFGHQAPMSPFGQMAGFGQQIDPTWQQRVAQTFPFVGYQVPPVTIY